MEEAFYLPIKDSVCTMSRAGKPRLSGRLWSCGMDGEGNIPYKEAYSFKERKIVKGGNSRLKRKVERS